MRVVVFTKTDAIGPSSRYRFLQYRAALAREGIELDARPLFGPGWFRILTIRPRALRLVAKTLYAALRFAARASQLCTVGRADLAVVEHQLFPYLPAFAERWLGRRRRWLLEFDDAIHLTRLHDRKMRTLCRLADRVVVGNRHLADFARPLAKDVAVVPTTIDLDRYPEVARPARAVPVLGWIGLPYNFPALEALAAPLRELARERRFVLRVVSAGRPKLDGVPLEVVPWTEAGEVAELAGFDVGLMPLADDAWSRGKCGLKILQAFAAGAPVVASPVGVNREIVRHGENGFLASTPAAWHDALRTLLDDPALRARMGRAGRATVARDYALAQWAPRIAALWRETAKGPT